MTPQKVAVRDTTGAVLGWMNVDDPRWLERRYIRFVRATNVRYYGTGLLSAHRFAAPNHMDPSFEVVELPVETYVTPPAIGKEGTYRAGSVDFCLGWDGHIDALRNIRQFEATR
jgi:hypothetical protein